VLFSFQGIPYAGGHHRTTDIEVVAAVDPGMTNVEAVVALRKGSLSSRQLHHDDNMVKTVELEYVLRLCISH
jgi:hypothetical protein